MLHKLDVRALMVRFHIFNHIDILDDEAERGIGVGDGGAGKSVSSTNLRVSVIFRIPPEESTECLHRQRDLLQVYPNHTLLQEK